ncbi:MAG: outer membrane protein assembly factor BamC [Candidatus Endonucleobacter bathymodioli]|uniref:Outer membrane protein assembly factor BamC n=1 Tax=Candidatus Endonucleibacter bathymodioli TaxID=539814 RepID=A0AA90NTB8_9GAMM|nr:outer membrane protein assembly factor BamC [Candidatus Endonucleobacter bathymodioli]MDP0590302.1 outer membrane protein assembly factor BamC [Candidatus Endonucleobacter bathymodioli]
MRPMLQNLPLMICVISLTGCSGKDGYFRDKSNDYVKEYTISPLSVPEGMNTKPLGSVMMIPPATVVDIELAEKFKVPRPDQRLKSKYSGDQYSVERRGDDVWIIASGSMNEVWLRLDDFFKYIKLPLVIQDTSKGFLETDWFNFGNADDYGVVSRAIGNMVGISDLELMEDRFQLEVRQGDEDSVSEIHIQHKGRSPVSSGDKPLSEPSSWDNLGERSQRMNEALASDMLVFLVGSKGGSSVSLLAQDLDADTNTELTLDGNGNPLLSIKGLPFGHSWLAIGDALSSAGITIVDRNQSIGIYYLSKDSEATIKSQGKPGFFARLFSSKKEKGVVEPEILHLRVSKFPDSIQVSVEKDLATSADKDQSQKLLELVRDNLKL